jgi:rhodanese-related sulfurtransferase
MGNPFSALFGRHRDDASLPASISAEQALTLVADGATLVDVREPAEWRSGHAPRAIHIPLGQLPQRSGRLPTDRPVVVVCASGSRSRTAAKQLRAAGMEATSLSGGLSAWQAVGGSVRAGR